MDELLEDIEVVEKKEKYISFSEYSTYKACPHKWFNSYINKIKEPKNTFLVFGSSVHSSIEEVIQTNPSNMQFRTIFNKYLKKESNGVLLDSYFGKNLIQDGVGLLNKLDYANRFKDWSMVAVEEELFLPLTEFEGETIFFKGFIDYSARKVSDDSIYMVVDWKTALKRWDLDKKVGIYNFKTLLEKFNNKTITEEETEDLLKKIFFGQTVLYREFFSRKHNIPLEKVIIRYYVLERSPAEISQFEIEISPEFHEFILNDIKKCALEIAAIKKQVNEGEKMKGLSKAKDTFGMKSSCTYCWYKKDYCNAKKTK